MSGMNPLMNPNLSQELMFGAPVPQMAAPAMQPTSQAPGTGPLVPQSVLAQIAPSGAGAGVAGASSGAQGWLGKIGGLEGVGSIAQAIGSIGQVYAAIKGIGLAKDQLNLSREAYQTNLKNQTQTYNTSLEDRIRARYNTENRGASEADRYLAKHAL